MTIQPGQIYRSLSNRHHPADGPVRIKVVGAPSPYNLNRYEHGRATVVTLTRNGREIRKRRINASQLHATPLTPNGQPRRTGYVLDTPDNR